MDFVVDSPPLGLIGTLIRLMSYILTFMLMMANVATLILVEEFEYLDNFLKSQVKKIMRYGISSETLIKDIFKQITDFYAEYKNVVRDMNDIFKLPIHLYLIYITMFTIHSILINFLTFAQSGSHNEVVEYLYLFNTIADMVSSTKNNFVHEFPIPNLFRHQNNPSNKLNFIHPSSHSDD
ncbi:hypothetical protein JTB14_008143 [Gonioctena quinquepunctata]|nr:hypothetical protein JTB14_008143 [Gonioctena quinquepunctata]